jgi:hypothetical protein
LTSLANSRARVARRSVAIDSMLVIHRLGGRLALPEDGGWPLPTAGGQRRTDTACCMHRPTKPVFCSRVRRQREASVCWDGRPNFNLHALHASLRPLDACARHAPEVEGGGPTGPTTHVTQLPLAPALQSLRLFESFDSATGALARGRRPLGGTPLRARARYLTSAFAPASSSFFLAASASALFTPSLTGFGAPSTRSLASFRPSPVISRTALITLTLFSP